MPNFLFTFAASDPTPGYITDVTLNGGVMTTVIGMGVVFLVLIILYFFVSILLKVMRGVEGRGKKKKAAPAPAPVVEAAPAPAVEAAPAGLSAKTVAAIMAAVAAASGTPIKQLKFNAIRRIPGASSAWSGSGNADIISGRQQYL